jgi:hypothetical protein
MMPRFSLFTMFAITAYSGVIFSGLRSPGTLAATWVVILLIAIGAACRPLGDTAWFARGFLGGAALGFLIVTAVYTVLAFLSKSNLTEHHGGFVAAVCFQLTAGLMGGRVTYLAQRN